MVTQQAQSIEDKISAGCLILADEPGIEDLLQQKRFAQIMYVVWAEVFYCPCS